MDFPINAAGVALLKEFETFVGHAYPDPYSPLGKELQRRGRWFQYLARPFALGAEYASLSGAPWTFGYGFTDGVEEGDTITQAQADIYLAEGLAVYTEDVGEACTVTPSANELAAMVCLAWNIGLAGFRKSTVLKCHNRGDHQAAARAFGLWNKAGGQESRGLTRRRAAEAALYLKAGDEPMPQVVEAESSLAKSPIVAATSTATVVSTMALATEVSSQVKAIRENLGDWAPYGAIGLVAVLGGIVVWQRVKQRRGGWA